MNVRLAAPLAVVAVLLTAVPAAAASRFQHDVRLVDGHLRIAIEYGPAELGESLRSAEIVCGLGERALAGSETELAAADWSTLGQVVDRLAAAESHRVEVAFRNADSVLRDLRERYERRWAGESERLGRLRRAVAAARGGIATMRVAVRRLTRPYANWKAHECEAAMEGVADAFQQAPAGLERINVGMLGLWRLAESP
jgi:hypothetical protein